MKIINVAHHGLGSNQVRNHDVLQVHPRQQGMIIKENCDNIDLIH